MRPSSGTRIDLRVVGGWKGTCARCFVIIGEFRLGVRSRRGVVSVRIGVGRRAPLGLASVHGRSTDRAGESFRGSALWPLAVEPRALPRKSRARGPFRFQERTTGSRLLWGHDPDVGFRERTVHGYIATAMS